MIDTGSDFVDAHRDVDRNAIEAYGEMSLSERARLIESVCRTAAEIERSRLQAGMPPSEPAPWPPSTLEFLRRHAPNARR